MTVGLVLLAVGAVSVSVLAVGTRRPLAGAVPDFDGYLRRWATLHGGFDPSATRVTRRWLGLAYRLGRPLARGGVQPDVVTLVGLVVGAAVLPAAYARGHWPILAAFVVAGSGVLDNLDGCVAVLTDRASAFGYVLDSVVDRITDGVYLLCLYAVGAPAVVCVSAGAALFLLEYTRSRAGNAGMGEIGVVTAGERPTRVVVTSLALLAAGAFPAHAGLAAASGAGAQAGLCVVSFGQLLFVVRRRLQGVSGPAQPPAVTPGR